MRLALIAARARNGVIGKDNALPWHLPEDLRQFKAITLGKPVIMGRKTWESLPEKFRPLPGRRNLVISRNSAFAAPGAEVLSSLDAACALLAAEAEAVVIGGAELYRLALPRAERIYLTEIDADFDGDAHFPQLPPDEWIETERLAAVGASGLGYAFVRMDRRRSAAA